MTTPLISVITPTWQRHDMLLEACVPSVQAQTWPNVEHIIVSDGPDEYLREFFHDSTPPNQCQDIRQGRRYPVWYYELPEHDPALHWGVPARLRGIEAAAGSIIAYLDDDDLYQPEHCQLLATALLENPSARWAYSMMRSHQPGEVEDAIIGIGQLQFGGIGTPMIMHWKDLLKVATWGASGAGEDWELVAAWLGAGAERVKVDAITVDVWASMHHGR